MLTLSPTREAGVVYTRPWMVELVLDLAGYLPESRLPEMATLRKRNQSLDFTSIPFQSKSLALPRLRISIGSFLSAYGMGVYKMLKYDLPR